MLFAHPFTIYAINKRTPNSVRGLVEASTVLGKWATL